jgi:hypothetical protein
MSMTYRVDVPAVLKTLKGGDRITATVYEGDTSRLYKVRGVTSPATQTLSALPPVSYVCPSPGERASSTTDLARVRNPARRFRPCG